DKVLSGSINWNGVIEVLTTSSYDNSTVAQIIKLLEDSQSKKSKSEKLMSKFAKIYTPTVLITAILMAVVVPMFTGYDTFSEWVYKALTFLMISCPCALVVSIPMTFFAGIGGASKKGILVKGGNYLEALNDVTAIVLDKTGTLTTGKLKVSGISPSPAQNITSEQLMQFVTIAEAGSNHPIAEAVTREGVKYSTEKFEIISREELAGRGVCVKIKVDTDSNPSDII
ncbi:MAG: HAD-IC family P-type ATPase, partial [Niameybacter sp.]